MFIQFSSWEQLLDWIENGLPIDIEEHRKKILNYMNTRKQDIKHKWIELFDTIKQNKFNRDL